MTNKNKNKKANNNNNKSNDFDDILNFINNNSNNNNSATSTTTSPPVIHIESSKSQPVDSLKNEKALFDEKLRIINKLFEDNLPVISKPTNSTAKSNSKFTPKPVQVKKPITAEISGISFYDNGKNYLQIIKEKELPLETLLKLNKVSKPTNSTTNNKSTTTATTANKDNKEKENYGYIDPKTIKSITDEEAIQLFKLFGKTKNEVGRIFIAFQFFVFHQNRSLTDKNEYANFISKVIMDESLLVNACGKKIILNEGTGKSEPNSIILNQIYSNKDKLKSIFKELPESSIQVQLFKNNIKSILNLISNPNDPSSNMNLLSSVIFYQKVFENNPPTTAAQYCFLEFYYNELKNGLTLSTYYCDVVDNKIQDLIKYKHLNEENNSSPNN